MNSSTAKGPFRAVVLAHATETELLGLLGQNALDEVRRARATAHLERCTICRLRLERRQAELAAETLPPAEEETVASVAKPVRSLWKAIAPGIRRLAEPIAVLVADAGALVARQGPPPLAPQWAGKTAGPKDPRQQRMEWQLKDEDENVAVELAAAGLGQAQAFIDLTIRLVGPGATPPPAEIEILQQDGHFRVTGDAIDFAKKGAKLPKGSYRVRIAAMLPAGKRIWEFQFDANQSGAP
jgi:hypothetical protein